MYNSANVLTRVNAFSTKDEIHLYEFSYADNSVRRVFTDSQNTALLTNIEGGGLTELEAKYHLTCLTINLRTGTILFLDKGKALYGILMEKRRSFC